MQYIVLIGYGIALITFMVFALLAVIHALKYRYLSPRVTFVTVLFALVSVGLIGASVYLLFQIL